MARVWEQFLSERDNAHFDAIGWLNRAPFGFGVVEECVFDRTEACHAISLLDMDLKYADVIDLESAKHYLETGSTAAVEEVKATAAVV